MTRAQFFAMLSAPFLFRFKKRKAVDLDGDSVYEMGGGKISEDGWHHIALDVDRTGKIHTYKDGVRISGGKEPGPLFPTFPRKP